MVCVNVPYVLVDSFLFALLRAQNLNSNPSDYAHHRLSDKYGFRKPNDRRALDLMNAAAVEVMKDLTDLVIAYGVSDEYRYGDWKFTSRS